MFFQVLEGFLKENPYEMVVYVGDGQGDFCACTCLGPNDVIFARKDYPGRLSFAFVCWSVLASVFLKHSFDVELHLPNKIESIQ